MATARAVHDISTCALISGRLNLTRRRRRLAREIKTGSGSEGAIDPRAFRTTLPRPPPVPPSDIHTIISLNRTLGKCLLFTAE